MRQGRDGSQTVADGRTLQALHRSLQLEGHVEFTGYLPWRDVHRYLNTADVALSPDTFTQQNNLSTMIKIMEYMALGKPIVQFDLKEGRFSAQDASLYSSNHNQVADFADNILWVLDHPEERKRMGEFGRRRVEKELAWEHSVENLLAAYAKVAKDSEPELGNCCRNPEPEISPKLPRRFSRW